MKTSGLCQRRSAWTLVEMLLVVAVILVLAVVSAVVSLQLTRRADAVRCVSGLRQAGAAFLLYTAEYNKNIIRSQMGGSSLEYGWTRQMLNAGYIPGSQPWKILMCPTAAVPASAKLSTTKYKPESPNSAGGDTWFWYTYGLNTCRVANKATVSNLTIEKPNGSVTVRMFEMPMTQIDKLSAHVLLSDSCCYDTNAKEYYAIEHMERDNARGVGLWHGGKANPYANAFFADGHVEAANAERIKQLGEGFNVPPQFIYSPLK